jgi:uncharacterized protein
MNKTKIVYTLITGASEGLGKALALECARRKLNLILVALPGPELHSLAAFISRRYFVGVLCIEKDLSTDSACMELFNEVRALDLPVNMLINNAGIGSTVSFDKGSIHLFEKQIRLNVLGTTLITRLFIDMLKSNGPSYILNVGSMASFFCLPKKPVYGATKSFIYSFSKTLRRELKNEKVHVSVLCPGGMNSNPTITLMNRTGNFLTRLSIMNPEQVAPVALNGLLKKKELIIPGRWNRIFLLWDKLLPAFIKEILTANTMRRINPDNPMVRYLPATAQSTVTSHAIA